MNLGIDIIICVAVGERTSASFFTHYLVNGRQVFHQTRSESSVVGWFHVFNVGFSDPVRVHYFLMKSIDTWNGLYVNKR